MTTYVDSSAIVPVYVPERHSATARRVLLGLAQVPWTPLHALEVPNAFLLLVARGLITTDEHRVIHSHLKDDIDAQRLVRVPLDWDRVFTSACELSEEHTARFLTRSLDLLHVAAALAAECRVFVSGDDRQLAAAKACGLKVVDIKG